ncbi:hypothetical protein BJY04DRAFT_195567 [Aspergillus karnatakaensis]|uniref:uncharacterized protein n=1 Tax=Aspergillus karnatakaensis TaxID=1810916 RepID=UPI003CCC9987
MRCLLLMLIMSRGQERFPARKGRHDQQPCPACWSPCPGARGHYWDYYFLINKQIDRHSLQCSLSLLWQRTDYYFPSWK